MEPYTTEATVSEEGTLVVPVVPFAPGTRLIVTLEEAEPMDHEAFEAALRAHYGDPGGLPAGGAAEPPPADGGS